MDDPRRTRILVAMQMEGKAASTWLDDVGEEHLSVHVIGIGAKRMPRINPGDRVFVAGLGGALDPSLKAGDLVVDRPSGHMCPDLPWHSGPIHTAPSPVCTVEEKAALFKETGALAVDMELEVVRRQLPADVTLIGLRAISDPADMAVHPAVLGLVDDLGNPRLLYAAGAILRRPGLIPHLAKLRANTKLALDNLAAGVLCCLNGFPFPHRVAYAPPDSP